MTAANTTWPPRWPVLRRVDYFAFPDGSEAWIVHGGGCQRSMTSDGLCSCVSPHMYSLPPGDTEAGRAVARTMVVAPARKGR